jgi:hypothetical protein
MKPCLRLSLIPALLLTFAVSSVKGANDGPIWAQDPLTFTAITSKLFVQNLERYVICPQGTHLTFTKISGPEWLEIGTDGRTSGSAEISHLGLNLFVISFSDGHVTREARLEIEVEELQL